MTARVKTTKQYRLLFVGNGKNAKARYHGVFSVSAITGQFKWMGFDGDAAFGNFRANSQEPTQIANFSPSELGYLVLMHVLL